MSSVTPPGGIHADQVTAPIDEIRSSEERAARAWPETHHRMTGGWRLRYSPGIPNRRANSVLPLSDPGTDDLDRTIIDVEGFYAERGLPSRFMVSPAATPVSLDTVLAEHGYHVDAPTDVQWARTCDVAERTDAGDSVSLHTGMTDGWLGVYMEGVADRDQIQRKSDLIERIGAGFVLASLSAGNEVVSVGLGVLDDGWAGIFCMHTLHDHRRRGYAGSVLGALAQWAGENGSDNMYLQVERNNPVAGRFYENSGFVTRYGYHYRTREIAPRHD